MWALAALCTILAAAGCSGRSDDRGTVSHPAEAAGCWGVPEEKLNGDFSAILLRLDGLARPSGDETLRGSLVFVTGNERSFDVHGSYAPATGEMNLTSETFEADGTAEGERLSLRMVHYDDGETVFVDLVREGHGC